MAGEGREGELGIKGFMIVIVTIRLLGFKLIK